MSAEQNQHFVRCDDCAWDICDQAQSCRKKSNQHSELAEVIRQSLIDAHPGPLDEHDPMCASRFALPGVCNCSVARNAEARQALDSLVEQLEAERRAHERTSDVGQEFWDERDRLKEQLEAAQEEATDQGLLARGALEERDALKEQLEAVTNSWKMTERALLRMEEQLEAAQQTSNYNAEQTRRVQEQLETLQRHVSDEVDRLTVGMPDEKREAYRRATFERIGVAYPASIPEGGQATRQEPSAPGDASGGTRVSDSPGVGSPAKKPGLSALDLLETVDGPVETTGGRARRSRPASNQDSVPQERD